MANKLIDKIPLLGQASRPGIRKDTTLDRFHAFLLDEDSVTLTDAEQQLLTRLDTAFTLQVKGFSDLQASKILMRLSKVSRATAYRDLAQAKELFGCAQQANREAERYIIGQQLLECYRLAKKAKDTKTMVRAAEARARVLNLDADTPEDLPPAPSTYQLIQVINQGGQGGPQQVRTIDLTNTNLLPPAQLQQALEALQESDQATPQQLADLLDEVTPEDGD